MHLSLVLRRFLLLQEQRYESAQFPYKSESLSVLPSQLGFLDLKLNDVIYVIYIYIYI